MKSKEKMKSIERIVSYVEWISYFLSLQETVLNTKELMQSNRRRRYSVFTFRHLVQNWCIIFHSKTVPTIRNFDILPCIYFHRRYSGKIHSLFTPVQSFTGNIRHPKYASSKHRYSLRIPMIESSYFVEQTSDRMFSRWLDSYHLQV